MAQTNYKTYNLCYKYTNLTHLQRKLKHLSKAMTADGCIWLQYSVVKDLVLLTESGYCPISISDVQEQQLTLF